MMGGFSMNDYISSENMINTNSIEILIAKLYVFFLPFRLFTQLSVLKNIVGVCANYMPIVFHVLGLLMWVINEHGRLSFNSEENTYTLRTGAFTYLWLTISSIIMSCVIQAIYGNHGDESAFSGISGMIIYFLQYLFIFIYNIRVFALLNLDDLNRILHKVCIVLLIIGYFQVLVMNGIGGGVYDALNIFGNLNPSTYLPKLCLTGAEGATAGCIIGVFVFPYLISRIIKSAKYIYVIELLLWLIPLFFTRSSTAFIIAAVDIMLMLYFMLFKSEDHRSHLSILVFALIVILCVGFILVQLGVINTSVTDQIQYLLLDKATDRTNGSTTSRLIPLIVNWGAFTEYPILGVGNGLQGYFYEKYFPSWAYSVEGSDVGLFLEGSRTGIANGGVFIPSLLSGYGILGCLVIFAFVVKLVKLAKCHSDTSGNLYYMFIVGSIAFIVQGFQGDAYGMYIYWFILSLPFFTNQLHEEYEYMEHSCNP